MMGVTPPGMGRYDELPSGRTPSRETSCGRAMLALAGLVLAIGVPVVLALLRAGRHG